MSEEIVKDIISFEEAEDAVSRMIASHFNKHNHEHMRASIPVNPKRDDDVRVFAFISQRKKIEDDLRRQLSERDAMIDAKDEALRWIAACIHNYYIISPEHGEKAIISKCDEALAPADCLKNDPTTPTK